MLVSTVGRRALLASKSSALPPFSALAFRSLLTTPPRPAAGLERLSVQENQTLLNKQRLNRPSSPHFTIYQPQITWLASIGNRVTGVGLSVGMYALALTYLLHPIYPFLDSAHLVELVSQLPGWFKATCKSILAFPFAFHSYNGIRHLFWDAGYFLSVKQVTSTGWAVVGLSAITTVGLVAFL